MPVLNLLNVKQTKRMTSNVLPPVRSAMKFGACCTEEQFQRLSLKSSWQTYPVSLEAWATTPINSRFCLQICICCFTRPSLLLEFRQCLVSFQWRTLLLASALKCRKWLWLKLQKQEFAALRLRQKFCFWFWCGIKVHLVIESEECTNETGKVPQGACAAIKSEDWFVVRSWQKQSETFQH